MDEILETIHKYRLMGYNYSHIRDILVKTFNYKCTPRNLCDRYHRWCTDKGISPHNKPRKPPRKKFCTKKKETGDWQDRARIAGLLHLLDLVRAHGEVVYNRLTGEVVEGGFPNVSIPDIGTPVVMNSHYQGSLIGSAALSCAEWGK